MLHVALFEDQRCVLFHLLSSLLAFLVGFGLDLDLFSRHELFAFEFDVQLDSLASFPRNHVIELACEVFAREREVLREHHLSQDVLSVGSLDSLLILIGKSSVDALRLLGDHFV